MCVVCGTSVPRKGERRYGCGVPELPPPAPPETRTSGQLVAEALRLYGRRFWASLGIGILPTAMVVALVGLDGVPMRTRYVLAATAGVGLISLAYVRAAAVASGRPVDASTALRAFAVGWLVLLPVPFLAGFLLLPALAWLALIGLVVPVVVVERLSTRAALARAVSLARVDYVHALGSLAAVTIVAAITALMLQYLLVQFGDTASGVAAFIAVLLLSPLLLLAAALLYEDQAARFASRARA
jgi:hypothetical protein